MCNAAVENAANGNAVGHHECADLKGDDGVESRCRAEVDQGKKAGDNTTQGNCIRWDILLWVHMSDPLGEWEAVVTSESKCLTSCGCVPGNVGRNDENENHDCEAVDACCVDGRAENINKRVSRGIVNCIIDACNREEVGNEQDDGHDSVAEVTPENGDGYVSTSISDFLGDVCSRIGPWENVRDCTSYKTFKTYQAKRKLQ